MTACENLSLKPYDKLSSVSYDILYSQSLTVLPISIDELEVMSHDKSESFKN